MNVVEDLVLDNLNQLDKELIKEKQILLVATRFNNVLASYLVEFGFKNLTFFILKSDKDLELNEDMINLYDVILVDTLYEIEKEICVIGEEKFLAINNLGSFTEDAFLFDELCNVRGIMVLHFYTIQNLSIVILLEPKGLSLKSIERKKEDERSILIKYIIGYMKFWRMSNEELELLLLDLKTKKDFFLLEELKYTPKSKNSLLIFTLFEVIVKKKVKVFPEVYVSFKK